MSLATNDLLVVASNMLGKPVRLLALGGGGNHRLLRLATADGEYALKHDPLPVNGGRDRLACEWQAVTFLHNQGITDLPLPVAWQEENRCALYHWVAGEGVTTPDEAVVTQMLDFLARLQGLQAKTLGPASHAFLSPQDAAKQFYHRYDRLVANGEGLANFLAEELLPLAKKVVAQAEEGLGEYWQQPVLPILSPSDFGIHNMVRRRDGSLVFLDLEYFGWDDPAKLTSDVLWHPAMELSPPLAEMWLAGMRGLNRLDETFYRRWSALHPLNGLIWCLIVLNPFTLEGWQRLTTDQSRQQVLAMRMERAKQRLDMIKKALP